MKEIIFIALVLLGVYLLLAAFLYVYQRRLIYYPVALDPSFVAERIVVDNQGTRLQGWVLNPGQRKAVIYFGGNSEMITHRRGFFEDVFRDYSVYLINYRGYGDSEGSPSEAGLFSDALAIYDQLSPRHQSISAYGRSLGSGVAVYLAARRPLEKLILLTPYDSVAAVAQKIYPMFPVRYLIKDRFDSTALAPAIEAPVLITSAEHDREIRLPHTLALKQSFTRAPLDYMMISGAAHNNIVDFPDYREAVRQFVSSRR
ncbi:MAG: alpha/beta hydrolase [Gammaproteobacteria bacterium]|jgi:pimeloyl-ACP methyl ester carboxylesterase|nr:alpha/beta hydrolase [Gammaproteobacteria bacterium]